MTREQQQVFENAVTHGLVKDSKEAYELGAAALRRRLQEQNAAHEAARKAEAEELAKRQPTLF